MTISTEASVLEARVPLLERNQVPDEVRDLYDNLLAERGVVPNMYKALAHVPSLAFGIAALLRPLMGEGALPRHYKELIATRIASLNQCEYCISAHSYLAARHGATPSQIASYDHFELGPFSDKERAGFRYATILHQSGHAVNEAAFEDLSAYFNAEEIVELTAVAAASEFFSRINSALRIPVTPLPERK